MFTRIGLFLLTNLAVLVLAGIVMSVLRVNPAQMSGLLVMAAIFGFGGSIISLLLSKSLAARPVEAADPVPTLRWLWAALGQEPAELAGIDALPALLQRAAAAFQPGRLRRDPIPASPPLP